MVSGKTLRQLLTDSIHTLHLAGVPSPDVDARELVMHALGLTRVALLTRASEGVSEADAARVVALISQRAARIPLQHLLGEVEWGGVRLKVDGRALVPRPETEVLLGLALQALPPSRCYAAPSPAELCKSPASGEGQKPTAHRAPRTAPLSTTHNLQPTTILDIGTGTGAIALALKHALPAAHVTASDLSAEALALARENAELNGLDVQFVQSDLLGAFLREGQRPPQFDLIVSNPPYLPAADRENADPEVRHDPELALYSGADGLELARPLVAEAAQCLKPGGTLLLELDPRNVATLAAEMTASIPGWDVEILPDLTGRLRFLRAVRSI